MFTEVIETKLELGGSPMETTEDFLDDLVFLFGFARGMAVWPEAVPVEVGGR